MASQVQQNWEYARQIERNLQLLVKGTAPTFDDIDHLITQLRNASQNVVFLNFEYATQQGVEKSLWDSHILINSRYRKLVEAYKKGDQKKLVVERRKLEKRYADFIKTSQFFYKGYIQRLASHFTGMVGLRRIAHRLSLDIKTTDDRIKVAPEVEQMIELSCHATLLRLGDLSRYRNALRTKDRSWDTALAYYALANNLHPDSGSAYNQMAVISLQEGDHLDAVYYIYRALAIKEPHGLARGNLELEFKKIISNWEKRPRAKAEKSGGVGTLVSWFNLLHARFFVGIDFTSHDELENEVLSRVALLLKEQTFGETLEKFVLINIAAEDFAGERVRENDPPSVTDFQSFLFTLAFNVRFMFVLLQILQPELEDIYGGEEIPNGTTSPKPRERITATCRRVLPALRQYSIWLTTRAKILVADIPPGPITVHIKELWKIYADVLTRLVSFFPIDQLHRSTYLLEEDETTVGFRPFRDPDIPQECNLYLDANGEPKPRITDKGTERNHPNIEMQARVLDIILVGLKLQLSDDYPITLNSETGAPVFTFIEDGLPLASPRRPRSSGQQYTQSALLSQDFSMPPPAHPSNQIVPDESDEPSESHYSLDTEMHRMVESLVEGSGSRCTPSNETSYGMHSRTANEVFAPLASNGIQQAVRQSTPKMLPSLPGIWSSPFTPKPNELQPRNPDRPSTGSQLSPSSFATHEQRLAAAQELDRITGGGSWGRTSSQPASIPTSQPINQVFQESLAQQFMPQTSMPSSNFTDSSSLYAGTPHQQRVQRDLDYVSGGNNSTYYAGASDFDRNTMLQSSIWNGSQPARGSYTQAPHGGQGG